MKLHREPANCACFNLRAAARSVTRRYDEIMAPSGLLGTQFSTLNVIAGHGPCGVAELADFMEMDVSTATRNLQQLIASGYLVVRPSQTDKRRKEIRMTPKGRRVLDAARPFWNHAQDALVEQLGDARYREALEVLSDLRAAASKVNVSRSI